MLKSWLSILLGVTCVYLYLRISYLPTYVYLYLCISYLPLPTCDPYIIINKYNGTLINK